MNFIKKNVVMLVVLLTATLGSAFLVYQVVVGTDKMNVAVQKVGDLKEKIKELNKTSPIPNKENLDKIKKDTVFIERKVKELLHVFGHPYYKAITLMAAKLGVSVEELRKKWRGMYMREHEKGMARGFIFTKFSGEFEDKKWLEALEVFKKEVSARSHGPLDEGNVDGCVMEALGLPRKMEPILCKQFLVDVVVRLNKYMRETKGSDKKQIFIFGTGKEGDDVESLTFKRFNGDSLPRPDEIPYIFKQLEVIQDLLYRMKMSKVRRLDDITRESMRGVVTGKYLVFKYTVKITAPLKSIRGFINSLLAAFKDNRVYIVRSMTLTTKDEAKEILALNDMAITRRTTAARRFGREKPEVADKLKEEEKVEINVPIIGTSDSVTAEIKFDYVIYIGDEIGE
ncbi:MAG: hypothetical protein GXP32_05590 [Kiritimatiellaeota bacterium]|nr:hypothetical protein [Kiritimatiellota bacterium]